MLVENGDVVLIAQQIYTRSGKDHIYTANGRYIFLRLVNTLNTGDWTVIVAQHKQKLSNNCVIIEIITLLLMP